MKIVLMNGGLGNQLFQYIFLRWLEIKTGEVCVLDNSAFCVDEPEHNGYEIERLFGLKPRLLSDCFDADVWQAMMAEVQAGKSICQQLLDGGLSLAMVAETGDFNFNGNIFFTPVGTYNPYLAFSRGNIYFHGYWIQNCWIRDIQQVIQKELSFPIPKDPVNIGYAKDILASESVCMHVRRGDFVTLNRAAPIEYFPAAVHQLEDSLSKEVRKKLRYFIFSDDVRWCKEHKRELGLLDKDLVFVQGNKGVTAYMDMFLMSLCRHMILDNSSFVYLAALLNMNHGGNRIQPPNAAWQI